MKLRIHPLILSVILLGFTTGALFIGRAALSYATFQSSKNFCILLDAGHGGSDPGKVSASGIKEKDINLAITLKCKSILEQNGITVLLTRNGDYGLEEASAPNKKASDLKKRKTLILEKNINCAVSIHQNSFPDSSSHGSQVFYHPDYPASKKLATLIQAQLQNLTGIENHRKIKPNTDYYLLRDNNIPTVIAEICFLSNPSEAALITEEAIQEKAAFAIAMGIMQFLFCNNYGSVNNITYKLCSYPENCLQSAKSVINISRYPL